MRAHMKVRIHEGIQYKIVEDRWVYIDQINIINGQLTFSCAGSEEMHDLVDVPVKDVEFLELRNDRRLKLDDADTDEVKELKAEVARLKEYEKHIFDYVQGTGNTSAKFLGLHVAEALVEDHKRLKANA